MNLNDLFTEEKVRLDPKCWTGKKIGNPKTKMKGGTRVNNCVPAESVNEMDKSQTPPGRDGSNDSDAGKKEYTATPTTPDAMARQGGDILNKAFKDSQRVDPRTGKKMNTKGVAEDLTRRGFLRGLGAAAVAGAAGSALAGTDDLEFPNRVQKLHSDMMEKNPRYAKEHEALGIALARGFIGAAAENNKRWYQKTAELLQKYGVNVNEGVAEGEQQKGADYRDPPEADYGDDYQDMVARVKKLAGLGPLKTVYDPAKRVYRNVPTAVQPKK